MLSIDVRTEEKISKAETHKKFSIKFEKKSNKLIKYIFKLIKSFL